MKVMKKKQCFVLIGTREKNRFGDRCTGERIGEHGLPRDDRDSEVRRFALRAQSSHVVARAGRIIGESARESTDPQGA